ncbi:MULTISPECIES: 3-(methylthio)propionyl-CoA ligase [Pseudomonas]|uniref:Long-chain-fatty-acid--CoA ligase n=1 Tax=Pseudomonas petroselini TaxID=2899822 RepID=A0ABS8QPV5_9PSED|nr:MULTISPECIES: 3-(methylthio)propionyl-CoA ligase [Pseudomonas]MCD7037675.1 long-chain-fatty-acid--CoA ligase [Pseudomonas petroselini]MCD7046938.1 long-chain-fatty-acid--CoA ligase [Pseudomonas petroselini]MCD7066516.1 long-chain-fatty-acid--CoA ligase [Pseudomonas petroselini]MCD7080099.1 long-chain-fatty-acid--CoA ligase [Pseudomonas petroselini]MCM2380437.1 3-(methylthio)propionyl-CoA ligase [Pseudomonas marginalis]
MLGLMQDQPLLISSALEHALKSHSQTQIASRTADGAIHHCSYADIGSRAKQLANALVALGVQPGDRIGTLAWNGYRHMELYFGVSGMGAVLHTINPRLFVEQVEFIANHAEDQYLFFDLSFAPLVEQLAPRLTTVKAFVALCDRDQMPSINVPGLICYEELIAEQSSDFIWPEFDERTASSMCYTSGTTGNPKGVLYSHRSSILHSLAICTSDGFSLSAADSALLVVPMFHVNAWGMPYAAAMCGAKLVLPGAALDGESLYTLMRDEQVTLALGVPTVWMMLQQHVQSQGLQPATDLCLNRVVIGGAAAPRSQVETFETLFNARVLHAWGMTEMSPLGTVCNPLLKHREDPLDKVLDLQAKQGRALFGVSMKIVDEKGVELPHDGKASGLLLVKGPWIASQYYGGEGGQILDSQGWLDTGDIATIDTDGYMQITDRAKDVIKSGGEWISSIDLENAAVSHPAVAEAAVIGIAHPKWQERPLLVVVLKPGKTASKEELLDCLQARVAKWWLPDDVAFVDELPHTATGKLQKMKLREQFRDFKFQS